MRSQTPDAPRPTHPAKAVRAWLEQLGILAELPYQSWAMMPAIAAIVRRKIDCEVLAAGWNDRTSCMPLATWADPVNDVAFRQFMATPDEYFDVLPIRLMIESGGHLLRKIETAPTFTEGPHFAGFYVPYGVRWGLQTVCYPGTQLTLILTALRREDQGRFTDVEQELFDSAARALSPLDGDKSKWDLLPRPSWIDANMASMLFSDDGRMIVRSAAARDILFLARRTGMGIPTWSQPDIHALPDAVAHAVNMLFQERSRPQRMQIVETHSWGEFTFMAERVSAADAPGRELINVVVRHREPADLAVASALADWALSPQEKRILIASTRGPSHAQLAQALGLTPATLKTYVNRLQKKLGMKSRDSILDALLASKRNLNATSPSSI